MAHQNTSHSNVSGTESVGAAQTSRPQIVEKELPPLRSRVDELLDYIKDNQDYTNHNNDLFRIYSGELLPFVQEILEKTLSQQYYEKIRDRVLPINILTRYVDKLSRVYATDPIRTSAKESHQEFITEYEEILEVNVNFNISDEFANMFKGYALEPYLDENNERKLRVLPYDRFLVKSNSFVDDTQMDTFIKFIGKRAIRGKDGKIVSKEVFFSYTDTEFWAFDIDGDPFMPANIQTDGVNPFRVIPFMYGNRSRHSLLPVQDSDLLAMSKMIPVLLTDLAGALMFQMFSIMFGVDVDSENLIMSPNAFWTFKSDQASKFRPEIGTVKPEVDSDKALTFIRETFITWLETKGIKVGSVGKLQGDGAASGISKAIDEMDTFEIRKKNVQFFRAEESRFWEKLRIMHNYWVSTGLIKGESPVSDDFEVSVQHDPPKPLEDRKTNVETVQLEVNGGFLDQRSAIERLYPDLGDKEVDERLRLVGSDIVIKQDVQEDEEPSEEEGET